MLRILKHVRIVAYADSESDNVARLIEEHLFSTLNKIEEFCENSGIEWFLVYEGSKGQKAKAGDIQYSKKRKMAWDFTASGTTASTIIEYFDDAEDINLTTYLIDVF